MFRCKIDECGKEFEDSGDLGMHLIFEHGLGEELNEQGEPITQDTRRKELEEKGFGGTLDEIDVKGIGGVGDQGPCKNCGHELADDGNVIGHKHSIISIGLHCPHPNCDCRDPQRKDG